MIPNGITKELKMVFKKVRFMARAAVDAGPARKMPLPAAP